jgi:hypothetical protein
MRTYVLRRELLLLRDGADWMKVPCAWGVEPGLAFIPAAVAWDAVVPGWLQGRRDEAVRTIEAFGLEVREDDQRLTPDTFGSGDDPNLPAAPTKTVTHSVSTEELRRDRKG